jgi:hypothetical protein
VVDYQGDSRFRPWLHGVRDPKRFKYCIMKSNRAI